MRKNSCEGNHIDRSNVWDNSSKVNIDIILNVSKSPGEEQGEDIITTQLYRVVFKRETGINFNIEIPLYTWTQKRRRKRKTGIGKERCAVFWLIQKGGFFPPFFLMVSYTKNKPTIILSDSKTRNTYVWF